jgi:hypothetical protein
MRWIVIAGGVAVAIGSAVGTLAAQDTTAAVSDTTVVPAVTDSTVPTVLDSLTPAQRDSVHDAARPVSPMGALGRSILIPGWGQAKLNRKLTGAVFVTVEAISLGMALKAANELSYLESTGSERVDRKKNERDDWIVILCFNHLMSALEAYVSAHLWDFPADLKIRPLPGQGVSGSVSIPVRIP